MFGRKARLLREERSRAEGLHEQIADLRDDVETEREVRRSVISQNAVLHATVTRLNGRVTALREMLDETREQDPARFVEQLERRVWRLARACARYRAELAAERRAHHREDERLRQLRQAADQRPAPAAKSEATA